MIRLLSQGTYQLIITPEKRKMLYLGRQGYVWNRAVDRGEFLGFSKQPHPAKRTLARGEYRLYTTSDDDAGLGFQHLELCSGAEHWKGFVIIHGLPDSIRPVSRVLHTTALLGPVHTPLTYQTSVRQ